MRGKWQHRIVDPCNDHVEIPSLRNCGRQRVIELLPIAVINADSEKIPVRFLFQCIQILSGACDDGYLPTLAGQV